MRNTFIKKLTELAENNKNIFLLVGDVGFGVVEEFEYKYPDRFLNVGIAEQNMTGIAAGLAAEGYHVFTYSIANFPTFRCAEQIRNDIDYHNLPVTVVSVGAGVAYGSLGYSHHAIQDYGLMRMMPNFTIASPGDPNEVECVLAYLLKNPGPSYLRLGKSNEVSVTEKNKYLKPGNWYGLNNNKGIDEVILSTGTALQWLLKNRVNFINKDIYTLPIWGAKFKDCQQKFYSKFTSIITVEDHIFDCGFGSWFRESICFSKTNMEIKSYALPSNFKYVAASQDRLMENLTIYN